MELQIQSKPYYCVLTSVAMCMDMQASDLLNQLQHDPDEEIYSREIGPRRHRGIQIEDLIPIIYAEGYYTMPFFTRAYINGIVVETPIPYEVLNHKGIMMFENIHHVVAWNGKHVYDPSGMIYKIKKGWTEFWLIDLRN